MLYCANLALIKASFMCAICTRVNGVLKICKLVQICSCLRGGANLHRVQIVHMNANCIKISINGRHFLLRCCLKTIKNKFQVVF